MTQLGYSLEESLLPTSQSEQLNFRVNVFFPDLGHQTLDGAQQLKEAKGESVPSR